MWHHSPVHQLGEGGAYMVTGATCHKVHFFKSDECLQFLHDSLLDVADQYHWNLQAWAVFPNHYHFVAIAPDDATNLKRMLQHLHSMTSRELNKQDNSRGRQVWYQYWDSHITFHRSYLTRLAYVHRNAVRHGIVADATAYPYCSAAWFERTANPAFYSAVTKLRIDKLNIADDY